MRPKASDKLSVNNNLIMYINMGLIKQQLFRFNSLLLASTSNILEPDVIRHISQIKKKVNIILIVVPTFTFALLRVFTIHPL